MAVRHATGPGGAEDWPLGVAYEVRSTASSSPSGCGPFGAAGSCDRGEHLASGQYGPEWVASFGQPPGEVPDGEGTGPQRRVVEFVPVDGRRYRGAAARGEPEPGASTVTARRARKVSRAGSSTRYANAALRAGFNRYRTFAPTPNTTSVTPPLDTPEMAAPCCCYPAGRSAVIGQAGNAAAVPCTECRRPRPKVAEPARRRPFTSRAGEDGRGGRDDGAWVFVDAQIG
jgi:hypothetical protein